MRRVRATASQESGAVLVTTTFALAGLFAITALVVDVVIVNQAQLRSQATTDSAALAAAQDLPNIPTAITAAKEYAMRNYGITEGDWTSCADPNPLPVATTVGCISVDDPVAPTHIRVRLPNRSVDAVFAGIVGIDNFSVNAAATAEIDGIPSDGDAEEPFFEPIAEVLRSGDPGGGYDSCDPMPNWLDLSQPLPPGAEKWGEYILVFEHLDGTTQTVCGTSSDVTGPDENGKTFQWGVDTFVAGTGGYSHPGPGMKMHVSCSQNFVAQDGWDGDSKGNGPIVNVDTDWHIVRYIGVRYDISTGKKPSDPPAGEPYIKNACGYDFTPITSEPPIPHIRLVD